MRKKLFLADILAIAQVYFDKNVVGHSDRTCTIHAMNKAKELGVYHLIEKPDYNRISDL